MLRKIEAILVFEKKRVFSLVTPCCCKSNKDGKFVNFKNYPKHFGYCHSCGIKTMPPTIYKDDKGARFIWDDDMNCFQEYISYNYNVSIEEMREVTVKPEKKIRFIESDYLEKNYSSSPTDNLTRFLFENYDQAIVNNTIKKYHLKSTKDGGTIFMYVNKEQKFQKIKICYYSQLGKRSNKFKVPFKNEHGYYSCLFGEHLLNEDKPINLVESEKTALVCSIIFPNYNWLSYGGINGLTDAKMKELSGRKILIIPDISNNAVKIMKAKKTKLSSHNIESVIWDMTEGKSDMQLKEENIYNSDLEDVLSLILL